MATDKVKVWDIPVRIFHWSLVTMFATAYLTSDDAEALHQWAGYIALALVAFRLVWGFIGSRHARFADFIPQPATLANYVGLLARWNERSLELHVGEELSEREVRAAFGKF